MYADGRADGTDNALSGDVWGPICTAAWWGRMDPAIVSVVAAITVMAVRSTEPGRATRTGPTRKEHTLRDASPADLIVYPTEPNFVDFEAYVSYMPGGENLKDTWRDQEHHIVAAAVQLTTPSLLAVAAAFPPFMAPGSAGTRVVFWVPKLAAEIICWNAAEYLWDAPYSAPGNELTARIAATVWNEACDGDEAVYAALYVIDQAEVSGLDAAAVTDVLAALYTSDSHLELYEALEAAIDTFTATTTVNQTS